MNKSEQEIEYSKYPVGRFNRPQSITKEVITEWINEIEVLPEYLRNTIENLKQEQLDTPYRDNGWAVKQVVHHLSDSHMNAFIRFKMALTESVPMIKTYEEGGWAELADGKDYPISDSLILLEQIHKRMVFMLRSLTPVQLKKEFYHPERGRVKIDETIALYAWHGRHHVGHIAALKKRMGWN